MVKSIGLVPPTPGVAPGEAARAWNASQAPRAADAAGLRGYVVAEVLRRMLGELEAAFFVEAWWDDEDALAAARDLAVGDGGTLWLAREDVLKTPAYDDAGLLRGGRGQREGRVKAIGTAYRREDFTTDAFFAYWRDVHAPISARAPGLGAYVVDEVLRRAEGAIDADAFVEQWWADEATMDAAGGSPEVAAAWADVANYAQTSGTFWVTREHVHIAPHYDGPGLLER